MDGVSVRTYPSGKRAVVIQFFYRGLRCRETLSYLDPSKKVDMKSAAGLVNEIQRKISNDTFVYVDYFPDSPRAKKFGYAASKRTVKEVGDSWLKDVKNELPHSTYRSYEGPLIRFVYRNIGDMRIKDVMPEDIRRMFRDADITLKTARNYRIPLKAVFERAVDDEDIDRNPVERVSIKGLIDKNKHRPKYAADPLSEDEVTAILRACKEYRPEWLPYWTTMFFTGLRTSEGYGLEWGDWRDHLLDVSRAVVERREKSTKTISSERTIELSPVVVSALKAQRKLTGFNTKIFCNPNNGEPLRDYEDSQNCLDYLCKKAKVRRRNQYQTRHTYAANMLENGELDRFVARQMGHKNTVMLHQVYAKWIRESATYVPRSDFGKEIKL